MRKELSLILTLVVLFIGISVSAEIKEEDPAGEIDNILFLQEEAFSRVAACVAPAVVSVAVTQIVSEKKYPARSSDPHVDRFLREFFEAPLEQRHSGMGSGVIIDERGYILTNEHVVGSADDIEVILFDGRKFKGVIQGTDPRNDLAVIKIEAENLPVAKFGDSNKVKTGQWVMALGNPFGFVVNNPQPTITVGVVSALHRSFAYRGLDQHRYYGDLIQTDAAINRGNSGGPLVNLKGDVIGINALIYSTTGGYQGISFAIPINRAKQVLDELIAGRTIKYGWLGVQVQPLSPELINSFNFPDDKGALIAEVVSGSPAEKYGLKKGYLIRKIDGRAINNPNDLVDTVTHLKVGQKVNVVVLYDEKEVPVEVIIGERPTAGAVVSRQKTTTGSDWRGLQVADITKEWKRQLGLTTDSGVVVVDILPNSYAQQSDIRKGDVIDEINREEINNVKSFNKITKKLKGEALIHTVRGYFVVKEK